MSFVITSISINTNSPIPGIPVASMSALERFTIVRVGQLPSACSGCRWEEAAGGSTGLEQIVADDHAQLENYLC